jgi:hypothetical protein
VASGDSDALITSTALPFQYRDSWTTAPPGSRPYKKCARLIREAAALKVWRACLDSWDVSLYDTLRSALASPPELTELTLASGDAKASKKLRTYAKTLSLKGISGEWVSGMIGPDVVMYRFLFFVTQVDGHPRVAAFLWHSFPCPTGQNALCKDW